MNSKVNGMIAVGLVSIMSSVASANPDLKCVEDLKECLSKSNDAIKNCLKLSLPDSNQCISKATEAAGLCVQTYQVCDAKF